MRRSLAAGAAVACLDVDPAVDASLAAEVRVLAPGSLPEFAETVLDGGAFELAERAAGELLARRAAARSLARMAGLEEFRLYLARWLFRSAGELFALARLASSPELAAFERVEVDRHWPGGADIALLAEVAGRHVSELPPVVAASLERLVFPPVQGRATRRAHTVALTLRELLRLWRGWLLRLRSVPGELEQRPLLLRHYGTDWGVDLGGRRRLRNFDFVVDGETVAASEVAVLAEDTVPAERDAELRARGYAVVRGRTVTIGPVAFATRVLPRLVRGSAALLRLAGAESCWREPVGVLLSESLLWRDVAHRMRLRAFLAYNDLHPAGTARTIGLRQGGCRAVLYEHSSSWPFDGDGWLPDFVFAFAVADAVVSWGPLHTENLRRHPAALGEIWELGCLWSEHARLVRDEPRVRERYEMLLEQALGFSPTGFESVVAVFDSSVDPYLLGPDDMVAFYAGIAAVAARLPRVLFLCKPKRPLEAVLSAGAHGREARRALEAAGNIALLDPLFETSAVVGLSALSVSACFTSTAVETIGAGQPALYFDPTNRFPDAFFRRFPALVATDDDELFRLVEAQLASRGASPADDLRDRFAGLEGSFDGRAVSRLRARLRAALDR